MTGKAPRKPRTPAKKKPAAKRKAPAKKKATARNTAAKKKSTTRRKKPEPIKTGANGRPSEYRPEYAEEVELLCKLGLTEDELGEHYGVSSRTISTWKTKHPEFLLAMRRGKTMADAKVANGLYQRAIGAEEPDSHVAVIKGKVVVTPMVKHYPPDQQAARFWLKNRQPEKWRENFGLTDGEGGGLSIRINETLRPEEQA